MATLMFSFFFGTIGVGYFIYGKKQQKSVPLIAGIGLCAFPYFISNVYAVVILGVILMVMPWVFKE